MTRALSVLLLLSSCLAVYPNGQRSAPQKRVVVGSAPTTATLPRASRGAPRRALPLSPRSFIGAASGQGQRTLTVTCYLPTGSRTASGLWPAPGMAASNLFPFGTRLHISTIGTLTVEDRSAPEATDVDVYMLDRIACLHFGRQQLPVEIEP